MKILSIGDVVGDIGINILKEYLPRLKERYQPDVVIANGENAAVNGRGITRKIAEKLFHFGVDCITLGNHTWRQREIFDFIDQEKRLVRPCNYPIGTPGKGWTLLTTPKGKLAVISVMGRTFMQPLDSPFQIIEQCLEKIPSNAAIFVDIHAETTSEKQALAWHLDGKVSVIVGTHTHVQTADERILPQGTGYISDLGMVGAYDGVIGMERSAVIRGFVTQLPVRFEVAEGRSQLNALFIELDPQAKKTRQLTRIRIDDDNPFLY
ncbi:hypothetical protein SAMN05444392_101379 [Seinonella peptonophila]|uniref:Capsule synthesis protein CapA domain-containing protein n=1 Tax=Seinonella peptonophila TaxID=112248 RepID=A0A1M4TA70_9BACL|nr:TIGR00282 family metallophosphoesterase [Seinonella peptonophila]SHE41300.1 hypothetical protein SAMN05444392_101379 [Seinonella peptonophila]